MTTDPQADATRAAFVDHLTAHLDRFGSREPKADPGADADPELNPEASSEVNPDETPANTDPTPTPAGAWPEGLVAILSAESTWSEPPDLRSAVLTRARALAEGVGGAEPPEAPAEPDATGTPAPPAAVEPTPDLIPRPEPRSEPEPTSEPRPATVTPLHPRRPRLVIALALTAAAAVVITLAVLGVQAALRPGPDEVFTAFGADGLRAKVTVTSKPSGFEVTLEAQNLPAAPPGSYYAAWLRRGPGPGDVVPIGTFHGRRVGGPIVLWSGVDPGVYRTFSVTRQRAGEPPLPNAPSAYRVLVGSVDG